MQVWCSKGTHAKIVQLKPSSTSSTIGAIACKYSFSCPDSGANTWRKDVRQPGHCIERPARAVNIHYLDVWALLSAVSGLAKHC